MVPINGNPNVLIPKDARDRWDEICPKPTPSSTFEVLSTRHSYWRRENSEGFIISYTVRNFGFGELTFFRSPRTNSQWRYDNELVGPSYVSKILQHWLDHSKWRRAKNRRMCKKRVDVPGLCREFIANPDSYIPTWVFVDGEWKYAE